MRRWFTCALLLVLATGPAAAQQGAQAIGEVQGGDAAVRGAVTVSAAGTTVMSGSQVTAGANPANIKLTRGGELRVCSGGSITITASANGREALVGLSAGAIETRYRLSSSADTIVTPDYRMLLPGPGDFHFAIGMKSGGDMCVRSLPGNSSAMIVNEVFGDGTHQVRPGESLLFQRGSVKDPLALAAADECGCGSVAATKPTELGFPEQQSRRAAAAIAAGEPVPATTPLAGVSSTSNEVITKVDAPIVFRGEELKKAETKAAEATPASSAPAPETQAPKAETQSPAPPAAEPPKPPKKRWYQRLGSALKSIFR